MEGKYRDAALKFAALMREQPFNMHEAADHMESWLRGTLVLTPALCVDAI
jgi:hypothetical protein